MILCCWSKIILAMENTYALFFSWRLNTFEITILFNTSKIVKVKIKTESEWKCSSISFQQKRGLQQHSCNISVPWILQTGWGPKGLWSNVGSLLFQQHERQRLYYITLSRHIRCFLQDYTAIALSSFFPVPLPLRIWFWQRLSSHQMHHRCLAKRKF